MRVKEIRNISNEFVDIYLANGFKVQLPPNGVLMDVDVGDLSGVLKFLKVKYYLND